MSFLIVLISSLFAIANATKPTKGSVFYYPSGHSYQFVPGLIDPNAAAFGSFQQTSESNGWGQLVIESNINFETSVQAHAAGYLEGVLTSEEIQNTVLNFGTPALSTHVEMFLVKNALFLAQSCGFAAKKDPYWSAVCAMHDQLHGLAAGYESVSGKPVADYQWFHLYNIQNSLGDIDTAFSKQKNKPYVRENSKCSGFVRKTDTDLFVSQATWTEFNQLGRVLKSYNFPWHGVANQNVSFSSYPGMIWSSDDFYQVDDRFAVFETTADVVNATLWRALSPNTVLTMFRTMTANRLAVSSESWSKEFAKYNSGTYNNQFFVVDYYRAKKRLPNNDLPSDTVWMTEQLPGYIKHGDITDLINRDGYFGSFNLWYWPETVKKSGLPALVKEHGSWFVYDKCPRYNIFKRGMATVLDEHSAKQIIRFNEFKTDPLSVDPVRSAENAIAARSDLNPANKHYPFAALGPRCHGAIDAKLTSMKLQASKTFTAVAGPTWGAQSGSNNLPPFAWDQVTHGHPCYPYATKHVGQLNKPYAFDWMLFSQQ